MQPANPCLAPLACKHGMHIFSLRLLPAVKAAQRVEGIDTHFEEMHAAGSTLPENPLGMVLDDTPLIWTKQIKQQKRAQTQQSPAEW